MFQKAETFTMTVLLVGMRCTVALGQQPPAAILTIDVENVVEYQGDTSDPSKFATKPNVTATRRSERTIATLPGAKPRT